MRNRPWSWVPTLYFAEGVPFNMTAILTVMLKNLNYGVETITLWSSLVTWPWIIKPLWAPLLDVFGTKRGAIILFQSLAAGALTLTALAVRLPDPLWWLAPAFMLVALCSATHDVAADGFYILSLNSKQQALYCGWQSSFYRLATVAVNAGLVFLVGYWRMNCFQGSFADAWMAALLLSAGVMAALAVWHGVMLPHTEAPAAARRAHDQELRQIFRGLRLAFVAFFGRTAIWRILLFLFLFRFAESTLSKITPIFFLDARAAGGIGLDNEQFGLLYGMIGIVSLLAGGIAGGTAVSRWGLGRCLLPMALALNVPDLVYVGFAYWQPQTFGWLGVGVGVEQFGFGFGLAGYMLVMVSYVESSGPYKTSHYAFMTGLNYLGVSLPGFFAGALLERIGYIDYFWIVILCIVPAMLTVPLVRPLFRPDFGKTAS